MSTVSLTVNGRSIDADVEPRTHLADFLRETQDFTGTHLGCEHGVCGACTILVDGMPTRSCITFAVACERADVVTIEGLDDDEISGELRTAFSREHGLQCGFCTPGMIISARDVVMRLESPSEHEIRVAMSGNLCRCTGYVGIIRAVQGVIADRRARGIAAVLGGLRDRLGPAGSGHALASPTETQPRARPAQSEPAGTASREATAVAIDRDWKPQTTFEESFQVAHPPDEVWAFFGRIEEVAACLPGTTLTGKPIDGHVQGQMRVKVGPISAEFQGDADISRHDATRTGTIVGSGRDRRSNSATRGLIRYVVGPGRAPTETEVSVTIGYTLTGVLAQFSRSGLVRDVARRLIAMFVRNLEATLSSGGSAAGNRPPGAELNAGALVWAIFSARVRRLMARLFRRSE
jgi:carbon-monoxide dehydrogenase small subunit